MTQRLVFRTLAKSRPSGETEPAYDQDGKIMPAGLVILGTFAQSVADGTPDTALQALYADTPLGGHMLAIVANPKLVKVYAP